MRKVFDFMVGIATLATAYVGSWMMAILFCVGPSNEASTEIKSCSISGIEALAKHAHGYVLISAFAAGIPILFVLGISTGCMVYWILGRSRIPIVAIIGIILCVFTIVAHILGIAHILY